MGSRILREYLRATRIEELKVAQKSNFHSNKSVVVGEGGLR